MKPTIGRIVVYKTTNEQRESMRQTISCNVQHELPAIIVAVWNDTCVNLKVIQDSLLSDMWITSSIQGDNEGQWNWPTIVK